MAQWVHLIWALVGSPGCSTSDPAPYYWAREKQQKMAHISERPGWSSGFPGMNQRVKYLFLFLLQLWLSNKHINEFFKNLSINNLFYKQKRSIFIWFRKTPQTSSWDVTVSKDMLRIMTKSSLDSKNVLLIYTKLGVLGEKYVYFS